MGKWVTDMHGSFQHILTAAEVGRQRGGMWLCCLMFTHSCIHSLIHSFIHSFNSMYQASIACQDHAVQGIMDPELNKAEKVPVLLALHTVDNQTGNNHALEWMFRYNYGKL